MSVEQEIAALELETELSSAAYRRLLALNKKLLILRRRCEMQIVSFEHRVQEQFDKRAEEFVSAEPETVLFTVELPEHVTYWMHDDLDWSDDDDFTPKVYYTENVFWRSQEDAKLYLTQFEPEVLRTLDSSQGFSTYIKAKRVRDCLHKDLVNMLRREASVSFEHFTDPKQTTLNQLLKLNN